MRLSLLRWYHLLYHAVFDSHLIRTIHVWGKASVGSCEKRSSNVWKYLSRNRNIPRRSLMYNHGHEHKQLESERFHLNNITIYPSPSIHRKITSLSLKSYLVKGFPSLGLPSRAILLFVIIKPHPGSYYTTPYSRFPSLGQHHPTIRS